MNFGMAGDIIGALAFWMFGISYRDHLRAAMDAAQDIFLHYRDLALKAYRHNMASALRPVLRVWMVLQVLGCLFVTVWLMFQPQFASSWYWLFWLTLAWAFALVPGLYTEIRLRNTFPVDWTAFNNALRPLAEIQGVARDIEASLQGQRIGEVTHRFVRRQLDRVNDAIEQLLHILPPRTPQQRRALNALRTTAAELTALDNRHGQTQPLDAAGRRELRHLQAQVQVLLQQAQQDFQNVNDTFGEPTRPVARLFLLFIGAPVLTGVALQAAQLCARQYNGMYYVDTLWAALAAFFVYLLGETALKLTADLFNEFAKRFDTVLDETVDAFIRPLITAGLIGTTAQNYYEQFKKVDFPVKEVGVWVQRAPVILVLALRSLFLWTLGFPFIWTAAAVLLSAVMVPLLAFKQNSADLKDDAKAFLKRVTKTEHKFVYSSYVFWLVAIFWHMGTRQYMPTLEFGNSVICWINRVASLNIWLTMGAVALGLAIVFFGSFFKKAEGLPHRIFQVSNLVGAALVALPFIGMAAWMGGVNLALPEFQDAASTSRGSSATLAMATETPPPATSAFDTAREAATHASATPTPTPATDALLGGHDAVHIDAPSAVPTAPATVPTAPHRADGRHATPHDTHRLQHVDPELRDIAESLGIDT